MTKKPQNDVIINGIKEISAIVGVSDSTIKRMNRKHPMPKIKGAFKQSRVSIRFSDLEEWMRFFNLD